MVWGNLYTCYTLSVYQQAKGDQEKRSYRLEANVEVKVSAKVENTGRLGQRLEMKSEIYYD